MVKVRVFKKKVKKPRMLPTQKGLSHGKSLMKSTAHVKSKNPNKDNKEASELAALYT